MKYLILYYLNHENYIKSLFFASIYDVFRLEKQVGMLRNCIDSNKLCDKLKFIVKLHLMQAQQLDEPQKPL